MTAEKSTSKSPIKKVAIRLAIKIVIITSLICVLFIFVGGIGVVHDNNNFPNLKDGDLVILYKLGGYNTGDLVKYSYADTIYYGRIVALNNDTVEITEESYTVNGLTPYETIYFRTTPKNTSVQYPFTVAENSFFILADYREEGIDSRTFSTIPKELILGKVVFVFRSRGI